MTTFDLQNGAFSITTKYFHQTLCCVGNLSVKLRWIELAHCRKRVYRGARLRLGGRLLSDFSYTPCSVMSMSKGGSDPRSLGFGGASSTEDQEYNPTPIINEIRRY